MGREIIMVSVLVGCDPASTKLERGLSSIEWALNALGLEGGCYNP